MSFRKSRKSHPLIFIVRECRHSERLSFERILSSPEEVSMQIDLFIGNNFLFHKHPHPHPLSSNYYLSEGNHTEAVTNS